MEFLDLSDNKILHIPDWIEQVKLFVILKLNNNLLTSLPLNLLNLPEMVELEIDNNKIDKNNEIVTKLIEKGCKVKF